MRRALSGGRSVQEVQRNHRKWLADNRHMKYLWIPYTDAVVVVKNNPVPEVRTVLMIASVNSGTFIEAFRMQTDKGCPFRPERI